MMTSPFLKPCTPPTSATAADLCPMAGEGRKGDAVGDSLSKIRFKSLPQNPHINVLTFTQSDEGNTGSGVSTSLTVASGPL
jgi:hypothetical protein